MFRMNDYKGCLLGGLGIIIILAIVYMVDKPDISIGSRNNAMPTSISVVDRVSALDKKYSDIYRKRIQYLLKELSTKSGYSEYRCAEIAFNTKTILYNDKGLDFTMEEMMEHLNDALQYGGTLKLEDAAAFMATVVTKK
jgi:hypothetical protein